MLKCYGLWFTLSTPSLLPIPSNYNNSIHKDLRVYVSNKLALNLRSQQVLSTLCKARRRVRYDDDGEEDNEEYGHNVEIGMLEFYSQSVRDEAFLVRAMVDEQEVEVLIFKGFSSCLSNRTSSDPSKSVIPARAVIKSIDRIKGPFDPSNIEYLEKGLTFETFKNRLKPN